MPRILWIIFAFLCSFAAGQEPLNDTVRTYQYPAVVVTATRIVERLQDVKRSISVISAEELDLSIHNSIGDVLSQQQGLYVVGAGQNFGMLQSFFLRGAGNNQTAVLIDGIRITDPSTVNNAIDGSELSLGGVERIEIVRGSHSTFFGSAAIGGVIHLITQTPRTPGIQVDAAITGGLFGSGTSLFSQGLNVSALNESGFFALLDLKNSSSRGLDATIDTATNPAPYRRRDHDNFRKTDLMGKIGYQSETLEGFVGFRRGDQEADIDREAFIDDDNYILSFRRNLFTYGSALKLSQGLKLRYVGGYTEMRRDAVNDSSIIGPSNMTDQLYTEDHYEGSSVTNEVQLEPEWKNIRGVFGLGLYSETMNSKNRLYFGGFETVADLDAIKPRLQTSSLFAHVVVDGTFFIESLSRFSLGIGIRGNESNAFGSSFTYELNPSAELFDGGRLFAVYSKGDNAPSLYQLFSPEAYYTSLISRGNSSLKGEESKSLEVGFRYTGGSVSFSASVFQIRTDHAIEFVYLWDRNIGIDTLGNDWIRDDYRGNTYLNIGKQTSRGVEFSLDAALIENLEVSSNLSYVTGTISYSPGQIDLSKTQGHHVQLYSNGAFLNRDVDVATLVRRPSTANLKIRYQPIPRWLLSLSVQSVGLRNDVYYDFRLGPFGALGTAVVERYTIVDLSQRIALADQIVLRVKVENLFNTRYSEIRGFSTRGRGVYVGLQYVLH